MAKKTESNLDTNNELTFDISALATGAVSCDVSAGTVSITVNKSDKGSYSPNQGTSAEYSTSKADTTSAWTVKVKASKDTSQKIGFTFQYPT